MYPFLCPVLGAPLCKLLFLVKTMNHANWHVLIWILCDPTRSQHESQPFFYITFFFSDIPLRVVSAANSRFGTMWNSNTSRVLVEARYTWGILHCHLATYLRDINGSLWRWSKSLSHQFIYHHISTKLKYILPILKWQKYVYIYIYQRHRLMTHNFWKWPPSKPIITRDKYIPQIPTPRQRTTKPTQKTTPTVRLQVVKQRFTKRDGIKSEHPTTLSSWQDFQEHPQPT